MSTYELVNAFRTIANTLNTVKVDGEQNLDRILGVIRYSRSIADKLENDAKDEAKAEEN